MNPWLSIEEKVIASSTMNCHAGQSVSSLVGWFLKLVSMISVHSLDSLNSKISFKQEKLWSACISDVSLCQTYLYFWSGFLITLDYRCHKYICFVKIWASGYRRIFLPVSCISFKVYRLSSSSFGVKVYVLFKLCEPDTFKFLNPQTG